MSKTEEIEIDEMETLANAIVEEEEMKEKTSLLSKVGKFTRKHGKKILVAGLITCAGVIGYNKGKKLSDFDEDFDYDADDTNQTSNDDSEGIVNIKES